MALEVAGSKPVTRPTLRCYERRDPRTIDCIDPRGDIESKPQWVIAGVAELVDALVLGTSDESRGGSSPSARTIGACNWL